MSTNLLPNSIDIPISPPEVRRRLSDKQESFCLLVMEGNTLSDSYRQAYKPKKGRTPAQIGDSVQEVMASPLVRARLAEFRKKSEAQSLLSINDRLRLLAESINWPAKSAQDRSARARCIEVYNKTAGDHAPERQEVTVKGDPTAPLSMVTREMTKQEKVDAMRARRAARLALDAKAGV